MFAKWMKFLKTDIWRMRLRDYPRRKSFFIRILRIIVLAARGFDENKCQFKASALTFYSLLSIVPIIAVMFGIAKGFNLQQQVENELRAKIYGQSEVVTRIIDFANSLLDKAHGGIIAGVGVAFLFWTIIRVLSSVENAFNDIWGVVKSRNFGRKFGDYLSIMLVCPILLVISGSLTIFISSQIENIRTQIPWLTHLGPAFWLTLKLLPFLTIWVAFTFIFKFIPNTNVRFASALVGGIVAGTAFQLTQWAYITFQIGVANYNAIYGSFAALPLFLIWFQLSWLIVLFGAEVSFAHQNVETYEYEPDCLSVSHSFKTLLSVLIAQQIVGRFCRGERASDAAQLSHELDIPVRLVRQILYDLSESGVISETKKDGTGELAYQPAIDVEKITIKYVIDRLENRGSTNIPVSKSNDFAKVSDCLRQIDETMQKSGANVLLKNL